MAIIFHTGQLAWLRRLFDLGRPQVWEKSKNSTSVVRNPHCKYLLDQAADEGLTGWSSSFPRMPSLHRKVQSILRRAAWLAHKNGSHEVGLDQVVEATFLFHDDSAVVDSEMASALERAGELAKAEFSLQIYEHHLMKATAPASQ